MNAYKCDICGKYFENNRVKTGSPWRAVVGQAARLIEEMISRGGTKEDLLDAIKYGLCCLDANKYGLDLDDAQIKFRYQELYSKYMLKEAKHE